MALPIVVLRKVGVSVEFFLFFVWRDRSAGVKGKVAYSYFISKVRNPILEWRNVGLEMLDIMVAWVIVGSGADGG